MISRRDFLNGCALSVAAGSAISPLEALAQGALSSYALPADYYPPTRMRRPACTPMPQSTRLIEQSPNSETASSMLKKPHAARYGVERRLKMLMYWRVHSADGQDVLMSRSPWMGVSDEFPTLALSRSRLRLFQQAAST